MVSSITKLSDINHTQQSKHLYQIKMNLELKKKLLEEILKLKMERGNSETKLQIQKLQQKLND